MDIMHRQMLIHLTAALVVILVIAILLIIFPERSITILLWSSIAVIIFIIRLMLHDASHNDKKIYGANWMNNLANLAGTVSNFQYQQGQPNPYIQNFTNGTTNMLRYGMDTANQVTQAIPTMMQQSYY